MTGAQHTPELDRIAGSADHWALFLDFDGTLVDIAPTPDAVRIPKDLPALLGRLGVIFGGALALVSGRTIAELDAMLDIRLPSVIGGHGAELRLSGAATEPLILEDDIAAALDELAGRVDLEFPGALAERKPAGLALHYRADPSYGDALEAAARQLVERFDRRLWLQPGKMVIEIKPAGVDKGAAIGRMMTVAPFTGRKPVFFGDDLTDEPGFVAVGTMGGIGVIVGERRDTAAATRLNTADDVIGVLRAWADQGVPA